MFLCYFQKPKCRSLCPHHLSLHFCYLLLNCRPYFLKHPLPGWYSTLISFPGPLPTRPPYSLQLGDVCAPECSGQVPGDFIPFPRDTWSPTSPAALFVSLSTRADTTCTAQPQPHQAWVSQKSTLGLLPATAGHLRLSFEGASQPASIAQSPSIRTRRPPRTPNSLLVASPWSQRAGTVGVPPAL